MSKSRDDSRAGPRTIPKRYPNLVGDGFCENPRCIIRWNGHEFGFQPVDGCFVQLQVQVQGGLYPLIDAMLVKLGITDVEAQQAWYEEHAEDIMSIETVRNGFLNKKSVFRFLDKGQRRHILERLGPAMQEVAKKWTELRGDMLPEAHRGREH